MRHLAATRAAGLLLGSIKGGFTGIASHQDRRLRHYLGWYQAFLVSGILLMASRRLWPKGIETKSASEIQMQRCLA